MSKRDVVFSLCDYAQKFIREYQNPKFSQKVIDAIVVDFINYYSEVHCRIELAMYTCDLRYKEKMCKKKITSLPKEDIFSSLILYEKSGIIESVNRHSHRNECEGHAKGDNEEAVKLLEVFIEGFCGKA